MRRLGAVCIATFVFMLDALVLDSHRAFAQATPAAQGAGPRFRADGPNADEFGQKEGYPSCKGLAETAELFALWSALRVQFQQAGRSVGR